MTNLSNDEHRALATYAASRGHRWKAELLSDWANARTNGPLHGLRHAPNFGPAGLKAYRLAPSA